MNRIDFSILKEYYKRYHRDKRIKYAVIIYMAWTVYAIYQRYIRITKYTGSSRIDGKVVLITDVDTKIGRELARELAKRGGKIIITCKDRITAEAIKVYVIKESANTDIYTRELDLLSNESIREFAKQYLIEEPALDILINNSWEIENSNLDKDSVEGHIGKNHFSAFLLTKLLLGRIITSGSGRIITISNGYYDTIDKSEIDELLLSANCLYEKLFTYGKSKLANILFTKQLAKKLIGTDASTFSLHSGTLSTKNFRYSYTRLIARWLLNFVSSTLSYNSKSAVQTALYCALQPNIEKYSGEHFKDCARMISLNFGEENEVSIWLWELSEKMIN